MHDYIQPGGILVNHMRANRSNKYVWRGYFLLLLIILLISYVIVTVCSPRTQLPRVLASKRQRT